jgi:hypothetical protein
MKVPSNWVQVACTSSPTAVCSSQSGNTDVDVWFDPANPGRRVSVTTCLRDGCAAKQANGAPVFPPKVNGTASSTLLSPGRLAFTLSAGPHVEGPYRIDGLVVATASGTSPSFPVYTVTTSLPDSVHWLADEILTSFAPGSGPSG